MELKKEINESKIKEIKTKEENKVKEEDKVKSELLLIELFSIFKVNINKLTDLLSQNIEIERDTLLNENRKILVQQMIPKIKKYWNTGLHRCLHKNAENKPNFVINVIRQLLKTFNYKFKSDHTFLGYTKYGKKIFRRYYKVVFMNETND